MKTARKFAKVSTLLVALAMLVQLGCGILPATAAEDATLTQITDAIMDMDTWASMEGKIAQDGDPVTVELINQSETDKAVKMTLGTPTTGGANVGLLPETTDWSGSVGLQMYMENPSDTAVMAVSPRFFGNNAAGQTDFWVMGHELPYYLISGETVTAAACTYGFVMLPAGFAGYVRMPYTSFSGAWYGSQPADLNLAAGGLVYASFDTNGYTGLSVIIDDVSVIKPLKAANVEDFHAWFDTATVVADANMGAALVNNGVHGQSLKISIDAAGTDNFAAFNPVNLNWSGKAVLQLYVKNLSDSVLPFSPRFFASNGNQTDLWLLSNDTSLRLIQGETVTESPATYGFVWLPENFEGYVQIPFSGFTGGWYGSANATLDLSAIGGVYFFYDAREASGFVGKAMLVDEFNLVDALADVTPEPTEPDPTEPDPTEPDPTEPDPTEPEPTEPKPTIPTKPLDSFTQIENFNAWTDTGSVVYSDDPVAAELYDRGDGNNALKITVTGAASGAVNAGTMGFTPANCDWSGKAGLQIYMKNLSSEEMAVSVRFIASNGKDMDMWTAAHEHPMQLISNGEVIDTSVFYTFVMLPANFEGYVRIPFEAYTGGWYGSANSTLDLSSVTSIYFIYDTNPAGAYIGKSMIVDDIALVDSMDEPAPPTGDNMPLALLSVLAVLSAAAFVLTVTAKKRTCV